MSVECNYIHIWSKKKVISVCVVLSYGNVDNGYLKRLNKAIVVNAFETVSVPFPIIVYEKKEVSIRN